MSAQLTVNPDQVSHCVIDAVSRQAPPTQGGPGRVQRRPELEPPLVSDPED